MSLTTFMKTMGMLTLLALIYIHMQMHIYTLAYKGKEKQNRIHELVDQKGTLTHHILALTSAQHLGDTLLEKDNSLHFVGRDNMMNVTAPASMLPLKTNDMVKSHGIWEMISQLTTPEAKAGE